QALRQFSLCNQFMIAGEAFNIVEAVAVLEVELTQHLVSALEDNADTKIGNRVSSILARKKVPGRIIIKIILSARSEYSSSARSLLAIDASLEKKNMRS